MMTEFSSKRFYKQHQKLLGLLIIIGIITAVVTITTRAYAQTTAGEIHGTKWHDLNGNGIYDSGEPGIPDTVIFLDENNNAILDAGETSTTTDANGDYAFINLTTPFTYTVAEVIPPTWSQSYPNGITVPSGNVLVTTGQFFGSILTSRFYEFTDTGNQVQSVQVPFGTGSRPTSEIVRDIVVGPDGSYYIYNGTFNPYLSIYDPDANSWQHFRYSGWNTVNNVTYGGIAIDENYVHLTDMWTAGNGGPYGLVRFDTTAFSPERYVSNREYIDITRGLDGHLYALRDDGSNAGGRTLDVFDLEGSCGQIRTISLGHEVRGVAVNAAGEIFGADLSDFIYHFSVNGAVLNSVDSGGSDLADIDVASDGTLVVGERFGRVILTDETLSNPTTITDIGNVSTFVAFASTPVNAGSHRVFVPDATPVTGIDFGNYTDANLGDWVWADQNGDGVQDSGETGMAGVTVNMICLGLDGTPYTNDDQVFLTTLTDAAGYYSFGNIRPKSYYLEVVAPVDYLFSPQDNAGDDLSDSDVDAAGLTDVMAITSGFTDNSIDAGLYQAPPFTPTPTSSPTATFTPTPTSTPSPTATFTPTPSPTATYTPTPTSTSSPTATFTPTPTSSPTATFTPTPTPECIPVDGPVLYWNDFEDGVGTEWSNSLLDNSPTGRNFLGQFNNNSTRLTLSCLPTHEMLNISFDLYLIRSWDGNDTISWGIPVGPDLWRFGVSNESMLVTTFSNWSGGDQAYPMAYPYGNMLALTGASEINTLGYEYSDSPMDAVYHLSFLIPHQADELELDFSALGLQSLSDESWGLDNVEVRSIDIDKNVYLPVITR